jgi:hypothetical protein
MHKLYFKQGSKKIIKAMKNKNNLYNETINNSNNETENNLNNERKSNSK